MKSLPFENLTFKTRLKEQEVLQRLNEMTQTPVPFSARMVNGLFIMGNKNDKPYEGKINGNTFEINRIIKYKNSFLPMIKGQVENSFDGTAIHVKMQLHQIVLVFMSLWLGVMGIVSILALGDFLPTNSPHFNPTIFAPILMFTVGAVITVGAFKYESNRSIKDFQRIFEAEISNM